MSVSIPNFFVFLLNLLILFNFLACDAGKIELSHKQQERGNFDVGPELPKKCTQNFMEIHEKLKEANSQKSQYYKNRNNWDSMTQGQKDDAIAKMTVVFYSCKKAEENYYFSNYTCTHEDQDDDEGPKDYSVDEFKPLCNLIFQEAAKHGFDSSSSGQP